jgi:putative endonuclease
MAKTIKQSVGNKAEEMAADFLLAIGYQIISKNYKYKQHEIDLIAKIDSLLVFVEVKYRSNNGLGYPETMVSNNQKNSVRVAAIAFIEENNHVGPIRYDIIAITAAKPQEEIVHFQDAF